MVQIKCFSNGLYSLKNSHIPFGMGFQIFQKHVAMFLFFQLNNCLLSNRSGNSDHNMLMPDVAKSLMAEVNGQLPLTSAIGNEGVT